MDDETPDADGVGGVDDAMCSILEQGAAETFAIIGTSDRKAPEDHHRDRVRHVAAKVTRCGGWRYRRGGQGVVADDLVLVAYNEGARSPADLIGHGAALQPGIERFDPTVEPGDDMVEREWLRGALHLVQAADQGALLRIVFSNRLFGWAG